MTASVPADPARTLQAAVALWQNGRPEDAERVCEALLSGPGQESDTLALLAEIYAGTGRAQLAIPRFKRLAALRPQDAATFRRLGDACLAAGQTEDAATALRHAVELEPESPRAHNNLAQALLRLGEPLEALEHCERAVRLRADYGIAYNNRGLALIALDRPQEALASYEHAAQLDPNLWEAHLNHGQLLARLCRFEEALADYDRVLALQPRHALALTQKASVLLELKRAAAALECVEPAVRARPDLAHAHQVYALVLRSLQRYREALAASERATNLQPGWPLAWLARGAVLDDLCELDAARECYQRALELDPHCRVARLRLLSSHIPIIPDSEEAILGSRRALAEELTRFLDWARSDVLAASDAPELVDQLFYLSYQEHCNRALLRRYREECARLMARWQEARGGRAPRPAVDASSTRLRIAIVSAHLVDHSVYRAIVQGWLRHLDRTRFELHLFHVGAYHDAETSAAAALADRFEGSARTLQDWVTAVRESAPQVLIFPEVGMDTTTLRLAALRLAPHQLAAWGHPETSALPTVDCFLSAASFEPAGAQQHYTEELLALPGLGGCYQPYGETAAPLDLAQLGLAGKGPLFVCPGVPYKYAPQHDHVLVDIARQTGPCCLVFFAAPRTAASEKLATRLARAFERAGLEADRYLRFIPWLPRTQFFGLLHQADVCLDTLGFSGFNTAMQAIECALPLVAYRGAFLRGRFASGILGALGLTELIADDKTAFVQRAVRLAHEHTWRAQVRETMIARRAALFHAVDAVTALGDLLLERSAAMRIRELDQ